MSTSCTHAVALVDEPLDRVGDLELAPRRRLDRAHRVVDGRVEQVDADEREVGRRIGRLLDESHDVARGVERGDAELARVVDVREQDLRGRRLAIAGRRAAACATLSNASTNVRRSCCSMLSPRYMTKSSSPRKSRAISTQCASPSGRVLRDVGDLDAEPGAVADRGLDLGARRRRRRRSRSRLMPAAGHVLRCRRR